MKDKHVFLIWGKYQSRAEVMEAAFKYEIKYFSSDIKNILLRYIVLSIQTILFLGKERPNKVWLQLPPSLLLHLVFIYKLIFKKSIIVADCHNAMLRHPWINTPFSKPLLKKVSDIVIVHNEDVKNNYKHYLNASRVHVLLDKPWDFNTSSDRGDSSILNTLNLIDQDYIIYPASFNEDEPIDEILRLEGNLPANYKLVITGNYSKVKLNKDKYKDLVFSGWITKDEYKDLFSNAKLVLGLTKYDLIQLSAANEGLIFEIPMVLSDTKTLRKLFPIGTMFTKNESADISSNLLTATKKINMLDGQIKELSKSKRMDWEKEAKNIKKEIEELENE